MSTARSLAQPLQSATRARFLVVGGLLGLGCLALPGLYEITYMPAKGLPSGQGRLTGIVGGFSGFGGPINLVQVQLALALMVVVGFIAARVRSEGADRLISRATRGWQVGGHVIGFFAGLWAVTAFVWSVRVDHLPDSVRTKFISAIGGGPAAVQAWASVGHTVGVRA